MRKEENRIEKKTIQPRSLWGVANCGSINWGEQDTASGCDKVNLEEASVNAIGGFTGLRKVGKTGPSKVHMGKRHDLAQETWGLKD